MRNFEDVRFGEYLIKTWYVAHWPSDARYYSPYPMPAAHESVRGKKRKDPPGISGRDAHGHQRDVLTHGVGQGGEGARGRLWVCDVSWGWGGSNCSSVSSTCGQGPVGRTTLWVDDGCF